MGSQCFLKENTAKLILNIMAVDRIHATVPAVSPSHWPTAYLRNDVMHSPMPANSRKTKR